MEKCPSNIAQKKLPGKFAQKVAQCIISLRVNRGTSNNAYRAELGLYTFNTDIQKKRAVEFWHHLSQSDTESIKYKALLANETPKVSHPLHILALKLMNETQAKSDSKNKPNIHKEIGKNLTIIMMKKKKKIEFDLQTKLQCYSALNRTTKLLLIN